MSKKPNRFLISISYPPLFKKSQKPFLSQNRQFQWTYTGNVIYPVIPAYAASLLSKNNYKVFWDDAISQNLDYQTWLKRITKVAPDLIAIETKTPVIKRHWYIIKQLKESSLKIKNWKLKICLMGDHVTALPKESLQNCPVDYLITGGDFDFMLLNLANHLTKGERLEPGFWYRQKGKIVNSGPFALKHHNLDSLPIIDRQLTNWQLYAYNNSNYKYTPGSYIMSGRDCWWGKCTFCSWTTLFPGSQFRSFSPQFAIKEIANLVNNYGVREIFDDSGTLPIGDWLSNFASLMDKTGLNKKVRLGANMRFAGPTESDFKNMQKANIQFLLYGLESANQDTLDKINKNLKVNQIETSLKLAKKYHIDNHLTAMIGYPWETKTDAQKTIELAKYFFKQGLADSIQATIIMPYPGTPPFSQAQKNNWLTTTNWNKYDMSQSILKSPLNSTTQKELVKSIYKGIITPRFILNKITSIKSIDDIKFLSKYTFKYFKKLKDF